MGFVTLVNVATSLFYREYGFGGKAFLYSVWALWWLDVAIALLCCWGMVHVMAITQDHALNRMSCVWLLPVVTLIVASSCGGILSQSLEPISPKYALITIAFSAFLVSIGLSLALMILTVYLYRLILHGHPQGASVISSFVPLGPTGQAGYSIILIGQTFRMLLPIKGSTSLFLGDDRVGEIVFSVCVCAGFVLWSLATMWLVFAVLGIHAIVRKTRFPFRVPFWGMVFPNGVYANLTITLYRVLDVRFFRVWGAIYTCFTFLLWAFVFGRTISMLRDGEIFDAPCLEDIDMGAAAVLPPRTFAALEDGGGLGQRSEVDSEAVTSFNSQPQPQPLPLRASDLLNAHILYENTQIQVLISMPNRSEYQPLPQSLDEEETDVGEEGLPAPATQPSATATGRRGRGIKRSHHPGNIDLRKLDNAFKRWTESIAQKMKRKKKAEDVHSKKEIWRSVFDPPLLLPAGSVPTAPPKTLDHKPPMTEADFNSWVLFGSSVSCGQAWNIGGYTPEDDHKGLFGVFKPKDEEPYGRLNPKTTKWVHRQLRWVIPFGRACLIPNLSYISEAAASLLDTRLNLNIVPRTQLVSLSSPAFFYDWIDRTAFKKGKPLPEKIGSMQYFLHGYQGRSIADTFDDSTHRKGNFTKRFLGALKIVCGKTGAEDDMYDDDVEDERVLFDATESNNSDRPFYWSPALQQSFREELEKLVILDYLMLNTDRGADNYMIKYCPGEHQQSLIDVAPTRSAQMNELRRPDQSSPNGHQSQYNLAFNSPPRISRSASNSQLSYTRQPHIHIAAIDNSLSFPHEHPHGWRSYTYGWLYLPVSLIGRPFSEKTRNHFLPLLTSRAWWEETTFQLRKMFAVDPDFHPKMFNVSLLYLAAISSCE
ncbi:hypothetical protein EW146_g10024 [Bondarzewia mesenterica]|uniref:Phosphatidylinositol 4-kinase n=1 Tax=Bondarzewia mesenterica TaxID=1095465 RepID=A0A4S4L114_9AGAM|nr:hypothetical protein EW146_g10024 [Bondarzewia mesenterica]